MDRTALPTLMLVAGSAVVALISVATSRTRDPLWWVDPRGPFAVVLFLVGAGIPTFQLAYGHLPELFGLEPSLFHEATTLLLAGNASFLLASFMPMGWLARRAPGLELDERVNGNLTRALGWGTLALALLNFAQIAMTGGHLLAGRYGEGQYGASRLPALFNVTIMLTPTLMLFILSWALGHRRLLSAPVVALSLMAGVPAVLAGGRKDLLFIGLAVGLARALSARRLRPARTAALVVAVFALAYVQAASRGGESLALGDRLAALREQTSEADGPIPHLLVLLPITNVLTAAMTVYPDQVPYTRGASYVGALANVAVPHFLTGEYLVKPAGVRFHDLYYGEIEDFGLDYALAAEGYQNFGALGVCLAYFAAGCIVNATFRLARERRHSMWLFIHVIAYASTFWALRTDANGYLKLLVYGTAWLLCLYAVARRIGAARRPVPMLQVPRPTADAT